MNLNTLLQKIPDPRPYPETAAAKNDLLRYAAQMLQADSGAQKKLAQSQLSAEVRQMLAQRHYLGFSVALSLAPSPTHYRILWEALNAALTAAENETAWIVFPVVAVIGAEKDAEIPLQIPGDALNKLLFQHKIFQENAQVRWLPFLLTADHFARIKPDQWFAAKNDAAFAGSENFRQPETCPVAAGQEVAVFYAAAYGPQPLLHANAAQHFAAAALPLMQVWQESLGGGQLTVFANPLAPAVPSAAHMAGHLMRRRMACDVFTANAVRGIRLNGGRVAVVIAAQEGSLLHFAFQADDDSLNLPVKTYSFALTPDEEIPLVVQQFLDLLAECRVDKVRILCEMLRAGEKIPAYRETAARDSFNPFFAGAED